MNKDNPVLALFATLCATVALMVTPAWGADSVSIDNYTFNRTSVRVKLADNTIVQINFDMYLKGVVQAEIGGFVAGLDQAKRVEAYKTQAVAAATYFEKNKVSGSNYDILGTTTHQAYEDYDVVQHPQIATGVDALYTVNANDTTGKLIKCAV